MSGPGTHHCVFSETASKQLGTESLTDIVNAIEKYNEELCRCVSSLNTTEQEELDSQLASFERRLRNLRKSPTLCKVVSPRKSNEIETNTKRVLCNTIQPSFKIRKLDKSYESTMLTNSTSLPLSTLTKLDPSSPLGDKKTNTFQSFQATGCLQSQDPSSAVSCGAVSFGQFQSNHLKEKKSLVTCPVMENQVCNATSKAMTRNQKLLNVALHRKFLSEKYPNSVESVMWRLFITDILWDTKRFISKSKDMSQLLWWRHKVNCVDSKMCQNEFSDSDKSDTSMNSLTSCISSLSLKNDNLSSTFSFSSNFHLKNTTFPCSSVSLPNLCLSDSPETPSVSEDKNSPVSSLLATRNTLVAQDFLPSKQHEYNNSSASFLPEKALDSSLSQQASYEPKSCSCHLLKPFATSSQQQENPCTSMPFMEKTMKPNKMLSKTYCNKANQIQLHYDNVKRKTGWHPYVWYLMCRRPELYRIGIRARLVAKVAGWEWEDVQKDHVVLQMFLQRIIDFSYKHPVPRGMDKKESKNYKRFAANSVRTPLQHVKTSAVLRVL
jgi:hypothetical protein